MTVTLPTSGAARRALIAESERAFETSVETAARNIIYDKCRLVTLSGPTCSGKTTTSEKLISVVESVGRRARVISLDDFYRDRNDDRSRSDDKSINYEGIENTDLECLRGVIAGVFRREPVKLPKYDFPQQKRVGYELYKREHRDVMVLEGIQAVYPEVEALFTGMFHRRLFVSVEEDITADGVFFTAREIRLMRRLVRDFNFRSASPEFTFFLWKSVTDNEDINILPNKKNADVRFSSLMPYEPYMMKNAVLRVLKLMPEKSEYAHMSENLMEKLKNIPALPVDLLPPKSVMHEFLG